MRLLDDRAIFRLVILQTIGAFDLNQAIITYESIWACPKKTMPDVNEQSTLRYRVTCFLFVLPDGVCFVQASIFERFQVRWGVVKQPLYSVFS